MVEPISIAHGLAAFVEMCIRVYGMIKDAHRASDELTSLGEGLESFSQFYQKIEQEIQTCATFNSLEGEQITHILKEAKKELMLIDEYVNKKWKYRNSTIRKIVTGGDTLRDTRVYRDKISGHVLQLNNVRSMLTDSTNKTQVEDAKCFAYAVSERLKTLQMLLLSLVTENANRKPIDSEIKPDSLGFNLDEQKDVESDSLSTLIVENTTIFRLQNLLHSAREKISEGNFQEARQYLEGALNAELPDNLCDRTRDELLSILALVCAHEAKWDNAEQILEMLPKNATPCGKHVPEVMHMVARAHLNGKSYDKALIWCQKARYWRERMLGSDNLMYYLSTNLLAEISDARGDSLDAKAYRAGLPSNLEGNIYYKPRLTRECHRIELELFPGTSIQSGLKGSRQRGDFLEMAAGRGERLACQFLIELGVNVESQNHALITSADKNQEAVATLLLEKGAYIDCRDNDGATPLLIAIRKKHYSLMNFLLEKGANVDIGDENGQTVLEIAVKDGNQEIVTKLLKKKAKTDTTPWDGETLLHIALQRGDQTLVKTLLDAEAPIDESAWRKAKATGDKSIMELMERAKVKRDRNMICR